MKRIITVLLAAAAITSLFAACGAQKPANADKDAQTTAAAENKKEAESPVHTLYYKDSSIIRQLETYPIIQLIVTFMIIGVYPILFKKFSKVF